MLHLLHEHERLAAYAGALPSQRYERVTSRRHPLLQWQWEPLGGLLPRGYYAGYNIGAQWADDGEAIVVAPKMANIDFVKMFMTCFTAGIAVEEFNKIYEVHSDEPPIAAPALRSVVSLLIVLHFLAVVARVRALKRGYVVRSENLHKAKGHIRILQNFRQNVLPHRYDRLYCTYDDYSCDIPENRLIKRALLAARALLRHQSGTTHEGTGVLRLLAQDLVLFEQVSPEVSLSEVPPQRGHKLLAEYKEALRLATLILRHYDATLSPRATSERVVPFVIDMPLLYEHYVLALLHAAYGNDIVYQLVGTQQERPDFLYRSDTYKAIMDTKYIPRYETQTIDKDYIRQVSGYGRDLRVLRALDYDGLTEESALCAVPSIIIYPTTSNANTANPFLRQTLATMCRAEKGWNRIYKIGIPLPTLS